jgi:hypothetical protein
MLVCRGRWEAEIRSSTDAYTHTYTHTYPYIHLRLRLRFSHSMPWLHRSMVRRLTMCLRMQPETKTTLARSSQEHVNGFHHVVVHR